MKTLNDEDRLLEDLSHDAQRLQDLINSWVEGKKKLKNRQRDEYVSYEQEMLTFLWKCKSLLSASKMARMIGWSRQRLYEKWKTYGFNTDDKRVI